MRSVRLVSVIQYSPSKYPEENIEMATQLAFEAASKDAKIIVLPELCMGRMQFKYGPSVYEVAQTKDGTYTEQLQSIAIKHGCYIAFGYIRLNEHLLMNSCNIVGPSGLAASYDKRNLRGNDEIWYEESESSISPIVNTPWARLGVMISDDACSCDLYKLYTPGSIDVLCLLTDNIDEGDSKFPKTEYFDLVDDLDIKLLMVSGYGQSCIIDYNHKIWTHGMHFSNTSVVGGALVIE
jgi:predicted amidohydrolase